MKIEGDILVMRKGYLGDIVLLCSIIESMKRFNPDLNVTMATSNRYRSLMNCFPSIDAWVEFPSKLTIDAASMIFLKDTALSKFDWIFPVNYDRRYYTAALVASRGDSRKILRLPGAEADWTRGMKYRGELIAAALEDFDIHIEGTVPGKAIPPVTAENKASMILKRIGKAPIVVFPGGGDHEEVNPDLRRWNPERFSAIIDVLDEAGEGPVCIAGSVSERSLCRFVADSCRSNPVNLAGSFDIPTLAAFLAKSRLVVGVDSGPIQLAIVTGCPSLTLSGPVSPFTTVPPVQGHYWIRNFDSCKPCFPEPVLDDCITGNALCMSALTPETVVMKILEILELVDGDKFELQ